MGVKLSMKKIILSITIICLFATLGFSQALKPVQIDSLVSISLPANFLKKDTLGQQIYSGNGAFGYMVVIKAPNPANTKPLDKERDLNQVLKNTVNDIQKQSRTGSVMNLRDTTVGSLKAKVFTLRVDNSNTTGESPQLRNFIIIYTREAAYTMEYLIPEQRQDLAKGELKAFSSSLKIAPELQRHDQYISDAKGISFGAKMAIYGGIPIILIIVMMVIRRNRRLALEEA